MIAIVVLNWNGWRDTILCLESIFQMNGHPAYCVVVCDNASQDGSLDKIALWADGKLEIGRQEFDSSPVPVRSAHKPIEYRRINNAGSTQIKHSLCPLTLMDTGRNGGYAFGNNVGIRFALSDTRVSHVWLLNNDTVVSADALSELYSRQIASLGIGMVGSTLLYRDRPHVIQAQGGAHWNEQTFTSTHVGYNLDLRSALDQNSVENHMDYVIGASMLVSREFLESVGLMDEDYFLYFEEFDWAIRARGKFELGYSPASHVFHKEGSSIGSRHDGTESPLSFYWLNRSRLRLVQRFWKASMWRLRRRMIFEMLVFARRGQFYKVKLLARVLLEMQPPASAIPPGYGTADVS